MPNCAYPISTFKLVSGLGDRALREARRAGLKVTYLHGRAFIRGADFLRYLDKIADGDKGTCE